jgi:predicted nucleotidyltransferase
MNFQGFWLWEMSSGNYGSQYIMKLKRHIPSLVKATIQRLDPSAQVILFGSHARKEAREDSDWDFLIISQTLGVRAEKLRLRKALLAVEIEEGVIISQIVVTPEVWAENQALPLHTSIKEEGIMV